MSGFVIRIASEEDVPGIRKAVRSSIEGIAAKDYPREVTNSWGADTPKARDQQRKAINEGNEFTWVAVKDGIIVGFSAFNPKTEELRAVYVAAEVAKSGVGTALLKTLEAKARELKLSKLTMHSSLTAEPFYRKHGYQKLGEITHTLSTGVQMKAVAMAKNLE
jgi:putative acetyltransferase